MENKNDGSLNRLEGVARNEQRHARLTHPGLAAHNLAILSWQSVLVSVGIHEPKLFHPPRGFMEMSATDRRSARDRNVTNDQANGL